MKNYRAETILGHYVEINIYCMDVAVMDFKVDCSYTRQSELTKTARLAITRWLYKQFNEIKEELTIPLFFIAEDDEDFSLRKTAYNRLANACSLNGDTFWVFPGGYYFDEDINEDVEENVYGDIDEDYETWLSTPESEVELDEAWEWLNETSESPIEFSNWDALDELLLSA